MTSKEYIVLKQLDGFLNEFRVLLYDRFYKTEVDNLYNKTDQVNTDQQMHDILNRPMFEVDISKEGKSFRKDYRLRDSNNDKLSMNLRQYEDATIGLMAMINDHEKENGIK